MPLLESPKKHSKIESQSIEPPPIVVGMFGFMFLFDLLSIYQFNVRTVL